MDRVQLPRVFFATALIALASATTGTGACTTYGSSSDEDAGEDGGFVEGDGAPSSCGAPKVRCGDACVDTSKDTENCGSCGKACSSGDVCQAGQCKLACTDGFTACAGGTTKDPGDASSDGALGASDADATDAASAKGPYCANLTNDPQNCGLCGKTCSATQTCLSGSCCNAGEVSCNNACTVLADDKMNCGKCGNVCSGATPYCSGGVCSARYLRAGVQNDVPEATATGGWTQCFRETFDKSSSLATLKASCSKANLMVACRQVGQPNLFVLAQAPRADVFLDTGNGTGSTHAANGVNWYYSETWSWGFAPGGSAVQRQSCDTQDSSPGVGTSEMRMCVHTGNGSTSAGYRCGSNTSLGNTWERIVYHAD